MTLAWLLILVSATDIAEPLWNPEKKPSARRGIVNWLLVVGMAIGVIAIAITGTSMPWAVALATVLATASWITLRLVPRSPRAISVIVLAAAVGGAALIESLNWRPSGWLVEAYEGLEQDVLATVELQHALTWIGALAFLTASSNAIVRAILDSADSRILRSSQTLKGGRIIGSIERLFILCMAMMGEFTAVGAVIAAKGLLRFPEVSQSLRKDSVEDDLAPYEASPENKSDRVEPETPGHIQAEYVLLGSFLSWAVALAMTPLVYAVTRL